MKQYRLSQRRSFASVVSLILRLTSEFPSISHPLHTSANSRLVVVIMNLHSQYPLLAINTQALTVSSAQPAGVI
jgi:hypothetical protein